MKRFLSLLSSLAVLVLSLRLPALGAVEAINIGQLGAPGDETSYGARPGLSFYLPVYRTVRSIRFRAVIRVSPAVDPHSTVTVTSGGTPQWSGSVDALRKNPVVDIPLPLPVLPAHTVDVNVVGAFTHVGDDICSRYDPSSLYLIVDRGSGFIVTVEPSSSTISGFLEAYSGDVAVVVPPAASSDLRRSAVRLAYQVQQLYRWRHATVSLRSAIDPKARNIVLGDYKTDLAANGNVLEVGPQGVPLLDRQIDPLLITTVVDAAQLAPTATPPPGPHLTLNDLGMTTETDPGEHPTFLIPFNIGRAGGLPNGLRLNASLAHTALGPDERATVNVTINGALVDSLPLATTRGRQTVEVAIPSDLVASANEVALSVDYDVRRDCHVETPNFTTTLFDDTYFRWDGVTPYTLSVGEFFRSASGRLVVLVQSDQLIPYAFSLLSALGSGNTNITSIDVVPFTGAIPKGYDAAIVVAPLDQLSGWPLPLTSNGNEITLGKGAPDFSASYRDPFGVLQTARVDDTPTLVASYWKDSAATTGLDQFGFPTLADQTDRVFMFQGQNALYATTAPRVRDIPRPFLLRAAYPIGGAIVALLSLIVVLARRKRSGGKVA
jgi:hypothetical protein